MGNAFGFPSRICSITSSSVQSRMPRRGPLKTEVAVFGASGWSRIPFAGLLHTICLRLRKFVPRLENYFERRRPRSGESSSVNAQCYLSRYVHVAQLEQNHG